MKKIIFLAFLETLDEDEKKELLDTFGKIATGELKGEPISNEEYGEFRRNQGEPRFRKPNKC